MRSASSIRLGVLTASARSSPRVFVRGLGPPLVGLIGHWVSPYSLLMSSFMRVDRYRTVGMARG